MYRDGPVTKKPTPPFFIPFFILSQPPLWTFSQTVGLSHNTTKKKTKWWRFLNNEGDDDDDQQEAVRGNWVEKNFHVKKIFVSSMKKTFRTLTQQRRQQSTDGVKHVVGYTGVLPFDVIVVTCSSINRQMFVLPLGIFGGVKKATFFLT